MRLARRPRRPGLSVSCRLVMQPVKARRRGSGLDIVVNNPTAGAMTTGQARLESDGSPWRSPLVRVKDISHAFLAALEATVPDLTLRWSVRAGIDERRRTGRRIPMPGAEIAP